VYIYDIESSLFMRDRNIQSVELPLPEIVKASGFFSWWSWECYVFGI
jgi:hypothetical protein